MLETKGLTKIYQPNKDSKPVTALDDVSLRFPDKGLVFLLGRSGSGKTTLLNIIGGLDMPTCGEIVINGHSSANFTEKDYDLYRNYYIGFVFQEYNLISGLSVGKNVSLALALRGIMDGESKIESVLRDAELIDESGKTFSDRMPDELSGGQKQRVAIARALVKDPKIILADEPTGALDEENGKALYELLKRLSSDRLVVVVTHDAEAAEKYGDRIITIDDGKIISDCEYGYAPAASERIKETDEYISERSGFSFSGILYMGLNGMFVKNSDCFYP